MSASLKHTELLNLPLEDLMAQAAEKRDMAFGGRITYSPKVFVPLTKLCRDSCGYCTFASPPARLESPYLSLEEVLEIAEAGEKAGCREVLFTLGERPEERYEVARDWLSQNGHSSTIDYLQKACQTVIENTSLLPHANAGALYPDELAACRQYSPSQGMMIESLNPNLECHRMAPDKTPLRRIKTLISAGRLSIPFTTGLLCGIGESRQDRLKTLLLIEAVHQKYGNIQEVIVQNFLPKPGTGMADSEPCPQNEFLETVALARLVLPDDIHVQAPPNLSDDPAALIKAGIDDWGGVSPLTLDHVNPERPWPELRRLEEITESGGFALVPRLTIYPEFAVQPDKWLDPGLHFSVMDISDSQGYARDHELWYSGQPVKPPELNVFSGPFPAHQKNGGKGKIAEILSGLDMGQNPEEGEVAALFGARGREMGEVLEMADQIRQEEVGDTITWVKNRNINYTNVCTFKCRFCGFSKGPLSLNLRGSPYLLTLDDIAERAVEAAEQGATEICLQGGIHPDFDGDYYLDVISAVSSAVPDIHLHGFTALEVSEGAKRLGEPLSKYLARLKEAGLKSLPGTAAEILDDDVREIICPDKINTEEWLECHRLAHIEGLRSNVTIMFGTVERPISWARHLLRTKSLQDETGGFTEFVPLPFVHMAAPIYLQKKSRRGPVFREAMLMHAIARIVYRGSIKNIQTSWVKMGLEGATEALKYGANDLGGTLMNENISRAAGAEHGQEASEGDFADIALSLGRRLEQRTTLYEKPALQRV